MSGKNGQLKESSTLTGVARERRSRQKCKFDAAWSTCQGWIKAEYQPESENSMLLGLGQHLQWEHNNKYSIIRDREFYQSKLALEGKVNHLRQQWKEKRPKAASVLTSEEEEKLWTAKLSFFHYQMINSGQFTNILEVPQNACGRTCFYALPEHAPQENHIEKRCFKLNI